MKLTIEVEREAAGKWIGHVPELPGCLVYGKSAKDATRKALALALRVIGDCLEHGENPFTGKPLSRKASARLEPFVNLRFAAA